MINIKLDGISGVGVAEYGLNPFTFEIPKDYI
jgi:hypothetical protein